VTAYRRLSDRPLPHQRVKRKQSARKPKPVGQKLRLVRDASGRLRRECTCMACGCWFDYALRRRAHCSEACAANVAVVMRT
jgi:hypothetical protein